MQLGTIEPIFRDGKLISGWPVLLIQKDQMPYFLIIKETGIKDICPKT